MILSSYRIIVFDIEATGPTPEKGDMVIETSAVPVVNDEICIKEGFEKLVNPECKIPILWMHGKVLDSYYQVESDTVVIPFQNHRNK